MQTASVSYGKETTPASDDDDDEEDGGGGEAVIRKESGTEDEEWKKMTPGQVDAVTMEVPQDTRASTEPGEVMSLLLNEIKLIDEKAADVLKRADLHTDSDIRTLTREDLFELFPGVEKLKLRRNIFEVIHKQPPVEVLLKKMKGFIPSESFRAALTDNGVLVDYLQILKDMKTQTNNVQSFLEAHINLLEEFSTNQRDQESASCGPVETHSRQTDGRPREARGTSDASGQKLQQIGATGGHPQTPRSPSTSATSEPGKLHSDQSDGRPGGAQDSLLGSGTADVGVQVGLPIGDHPQGTQNPLLGSGTSDVGVQVVLPIGDHPQGTQKSSSGPSTSATREPVKLPVNKSDGRQQGAPDPLPGSGTSVVGVQVVLPIGGHPQTLRSPSTLATSEPGKLHSGQSDGRPGGAQGEPPSLPTGRTESSSGPSTSATREPVKLYSGQSDGRQRGAPATLYKMVVSGKTFDTHLKLMEKVKNHDQIQNQMQLCEGDQDNKITFVFCPVSSRVASDVEAAMTGVKDDKPVILVLMHHTRVFRHTTSMRTWNDDARVVLHVQVFYHETVGLLKFEQNNAAVTEIQNKLLERFIQRATLYKMVVSGKTYDTHLKLMESVKSHDQIQNQMQLCEGDQDNKITFVFCPISSRVAADVAAAMTDVKDDKPVILVLMHHTRESRYTTSIRTWNDDARVVLHVNVFYHDTVGLLKSEQNNAAVTEIQDKLLQCFIQRGTDTSGNAQGVGADHKGTDHRGTGNKGAGNKGAGNWGTGNWGTGNWGTGYWGKK